MVQVFKTSAIKVCFERLITFILWSMTRCAENWVCTVEKYFAVVFQMLLWIKRSIPCFLHPLSVDYKHLVWFTVLSERKLEFFLNRCIIQRSVSSVKYLTSFPILLWNYLFRSKDINYSFVNFFFRIKYYRYLWDLQRASAGIRNSCWEKF